MASPLQGPTEKTLTTVHENVLNQHLHDATDTVIEKTGGIAKTVLSCTVNALPTATAIATVPVKILITARVPGAAAVINPAIDTSTQASADASIGYLQPKIDPLVDLSVEATKKSAHDISDNCSSCS